MNRKGDKNCRIDISSKEKSQEILFLLEEDKRNFTKNAFGFSENFKSILLLKYICFRLIFNFNILCEVIIAALNYEIPPKRDQEKLEIFLSERN